MFVYSQQHKNRPLINLESKYKQDLPEQNRDLNEENDFSKSAKAVPKKSCKLNIFGEEKALETEIVWGDLNQK